MKKICALLLAVLMLAGVCVLFGSCSGDKKDEPTGETAKTVIVGYTIYEPMNYLDDSGKLVGFDTELAEKIFGTLGYKVVFKEIDWSAKYTDLSSGNIDCIWNGFTSNAADDDGVLRSEKVDFSYDYMENAQVVVVKKDSGIASASDLAGKIGEAEAGSAGETYAKETFKDSTVNTVLKQTDALLEVKSGTAAFAVLDAQLAKSYCGKGDYADLVVVDALTSEVEFYAIGFKKGSDLTAKVNEQLEALAKDGYLKTLGDKYGVGNTVVTDFSDQKKG